VAKLRLRYVQQWVDPRHGGCKPRFYFRRPGFKRIPLPGSPGSPEFMSAYQCAMGGEAAPPVIIATDRSRPGSIHALVKSYFASADFLSKEPLTKSTYRNILERFSREHGDKPVHMIKPTHVEAMFAKRVNTPAAANHWLRLIKKLFELAVTQEQREDNPAARVKPLGRKKEQRSRDRLSHLAR